MTVGRVGDVGAAGEEVVRVDRQTPLGNPYTLPSSRHEYRGEREAACAAYLRLLAETLGASGEVSAARVAEIGRERGYVGEVRAWDCAGARAQMAALAACRGRVRLCCHCAPRQCHAEAIRDVLLG